MIKTVPNKGVCYEKKSFQKAQAAEILGEKGQTWENNLKSPIETILLMEIKRRILRDTMAKTNYIVSLHYKISTLSGKDVT